MLRIGPGFSSSSYTQPLQDPAVHQRKNVAFGKIDIKLATEIANKFRLSHQQTDSFFARISTMNAAEKRGDDPLAKLRMFIKNEAKSKKGKNPVLDALNHLKRTLLSQPA